MTELEVEIVNQDKLLCLSCEHFEDMGLREVIIYGKKGKVKGRIQVRFFCHRFQEYLQKFYSKCLKYNV